MQACAASEFCHTIMHGYALREIAPPRQRLRDAVRPAHHRRAVVQTQQLALQQDAAACVRVRLRAWLCACAIECVRVRAFLCVRACLCVRAGGRAGVRLCVCVCVCAYMRREEISH
jgi:hypothetical protein